jgi:hypothetical protein
MAPTLRRRINGMVAEDMEEKKEVKKSADDDTDLTTDDNDDDDDDKEGDVVDDDDHDLKKERAVAKQEAKKGPSLKTGVDTSSANANDADASEKATPEDAAATFHYYVFALLFMIGFMMHCRKYYTINCRVVMLHITAYILCPIPGTESATPIKNKIREFIFASFLLFCIWTWYDESPFNANHHNVCGIISLLLAPSQLQRAWYGPTSKRSVTTTANALNHVRCAIVIMYFMAGFHKINEDFIFHPRVSCAYDMLWDYLEFFGIYEREDLDDMPLYLKAMPYLGLVIELVPPIMLCFRSTQMYGVLLLVKLHWMLLPVGFADFGSIAQSFLFLFVAANRATEALPHHLWGQMGGYLVFFEAVTLFLWFQDPKRGTSRSDVPLPSEEAAIVFSTYAIIWWNLLRVRGLSPGIPIRLPKSSISLAALAAFIFFAMNPYLGLRTVGTLAMFSNLRTEVRLMMLFCVSPFTPSAIVYILMNITSHLSSFFLCYGMSRTGTNIKPFAFEVKSAQDLELPRRCCLCN